MLDHVFGQENSEENNSQPMERETVKGIICDCNNGRKAQECLEDPGVDSFCIQLSVDQVEKLSKLNCYRDDSFSYQDALKFAKRWHSKVACYVTIIDSKNKFEVRISSVEVTEINNNIVRDFAKTFRTNINGTFDPMGEDHEQPTLRITPF